MGLKGRMTLHPEAEPTRSDFENGTAIRTKNPFKAILVYLRQVFAELRKVVTPTGRELVGYTLTVIFFVVVMIALVFGMDFLFGMLSRAVFTA